MLEQLIYKWRALAPRIAGSLSEAYERLLESGRAVTRAEIERDVARMFSGNFRAWVALGAADDARGPQPEEVGAARRY